MKNNDAHLLSKNNGNEILQTINMVDKYVKDFKEEEGRERY